MFLDILLIGEILILALLTS